MRPCAFCARVYVFQSSGVVAERGVGVLSRRLHPRLCPPALRCLAFACAGLHRQHRRVAGVSAGRRRVVGSPRQAEPHGVERRLVDAARQRRLRGRPGERELDSSPSPSLPVFSSSLHCCRWIVSACEHVFFSFARLLVLAAGACDDAPSSLYTSACWRCLCSVAPRPPVFSELVGVNALPWLFR